MNQNAEALIGALEQRIAALEQVASGHKEPETERGRMQRERQERIDAKREARPDNDERRMGDPRPTSRQRREEPKRTSTALPGPQIPPRPPRPPEPKIPENEATTSDHPWKVTANGDGTVTVSAGHLFYRTSESPSADTLPQWYHLKVFASYAGGSIAVGGSGRIYASIAVNPATPDYAYLTNIYGGDPFYLGRAYPTGGVTVHYGVMPTTGDVFIVEIAAVSLADGVAVVDSQFLTHNPVVGDYLLTGPVGP